MTSDLSGTSAEALLRAALDAMVDCLALLGTVRDPDGRIIDFAFREANPAACAVLGLPRTELIGMTLAEALPDSGGLVAVFAHCVENGEPLSVEDLPFAGRRRRVRRFDVRAARAGAELLSVVWRDVTARFQAQQRVAQSEEHFRLLTENSSDVVFQLRDFKVVWVSPSVESAMGAPPPHWIGHDATSFLPPEDREIFDEMVAETATGAASVRRLRAFDAHGNLRWLEVRAKTYYDAAGRPDGHVAGFRIIDDEVAAEQAAEEARREQTEADARFRKLIENSAIATNLLAPDGRFLAVNPAMCELVGYDADTLTKMTWRDVVATPEDVTATIQAVVNIAAGRADSYRITRQYIHADGHPIWGELTISCIRDSAGTIEHLIAQIIDITEQVALRARQAESDARFRRVMETSNVAMALVTPEGTLDVVNRALCELLQYDEATLKSRTWQELTPPQFLQVDLDNTIELLSGRLDTYRTTKQFIRADGRLVWVDLSASSLRGSSGDVQYIVAQGVNITEEVEAQERLAQRERENRILADRLQAEMRNAAGYVESVLPGELTGRVEVTSRYLPALDLGGDCFHYRWLDDDHLKLYLIDASGHGIRPAFLSMSVHNLIRSGSLPDAVLREPDLVLDEINRLFPMEDQADSYFTIWYGIYQASTRTLRYSSAGHPPALVLLRDGAGVTVSGLSTPASPIGMFADTVYTSDSYTVPHGAQLLLYSDGAFELPVHKADGKPWYRDDFVSLCMALTADPDWTLDDLVERLRSLIPDGNFDDDCALVLVTFP